MYSCDVIFLSSVQSHITASRRALEAFLIRYPLCYGYWKKFADLERRAGYNNKAEEVKQERFLSSVFQLMTLHYCVIKTIFIYFLKGTN